MELIWNKMHSSLYYSIDWVFLYTHADFLSHCNKTVLISEQEIFFLNVKIFENYEDFGSLSTVIWNDRLKENTC